MSETMQGWVVREFGGPEVMRWETLPVPEPGPGQVLVAVHASGMNFAETRMRAGSYSGQPLPFVMGMEGAGTVAALGPGVDSFTPGQRVFGRARGCHADYVLFDEAHLMPLPDRLSFVEGAAIPVGWLTAWHALHTVARVQPGQRVLIEAVAGSVGSAALPIARAAGCWTAVTASSDHKLEPARAAGADLAINYRDQRISQCVRDATGGAGVDVALMTIGEATAQELFDSMGMDGKVVMFGSTGGKDITFNLAIGMVNMQLLSMSISTSPQYPTETLPGFCREALPRFADGRFRPIVGEVLPLADLARAHAMIGERRHYGKIILQVKPD
jgi:NADPH2:quinone reductase